MRVRIDELLEERGWSAYDLAKAFAALPPSRRVSEQSAYRLARAKGRLKRLDAALLDALCEVFGIGPDDLHRLLEPAKRTR